MPTCDFCGQVWGAAELTDGLCPDCSVHFGAHSSDADEPGADFVSESDYDDETETCPRCGSRADRLVGVTGRGGTRYVCEDCRSEALRSDRSFWHWYWKE